MSEKQPLNKPPAKAKEGEEGQEDEEEVKEEEPEPTCGDKCADGIKFVVKVSFLCLKIIISRVYIMVSYSCSEESDPVVHFSFIL